MSEEETTIRSLLKSDPIYSKEVDVEMKWLRRSHVINHLVRKYPELHLNERLRSIIREHTALIQTTCRRQCIAFNGLLDQLSHPRFAYSSGGEAFESIVAQIRQF